LRRAETVRRRPRGVALGGVLYLALPHPGDETPEGEHHRHGGDVMRLAIVRLADVVDLDAGDPE
jgi:hypothetical protein